MATQRSEFSRKSQELFKEGLEIAATMRRDIEVGLLELEQAFVGMQDRYTRTTETPRASAIILPFKRPQK